MNIPKIQVICEPRNHGFLNKFYRANNDSGILYHQTKVEYKSHLPYWHHYVPMWWPGLGDFGMNSGILIDLPSKRTPQYNHYDNLCASVLYGEKIMKVGITRIKQYGV